MDGRLTAIAGEVSRQEFDRLFDEEQAKVDAIRVEIEDVAKNGRWPGHLYLGGIDADVRLNGEVAAVNPSERRGSIDGVDIC